MIDDDEDDYEGYFLRPANEYNIKEKIIQANQESFAIPTPPSPRQHVSGERRVTFREQLVDYEPDEYSSEDDGYGGGGSGGGGAGGGKGNKRNATIETVADVHRDGDVDRNDGTPVDTIIEELHLDDGRGTPEPAGDHGEVEDDVVVEEEQLEGDYDEEGDGTDDRMEKHKTGVEGESVVSEEEDEDDEEVEEEGAREEPDGEVEEEEPTDGSSMDTEIHNPESSEDISSSPLKTYRSEADSRSGSGDSQTEEPNPAEERDDGLPDGNEVYYDDDDEDDALNAGDGAERDSCSDGERPLEEHRTKRSSTCRRKCCRHKKSHGEKLPYYNGFRSEYGLSREELEEKHRRLEARRQRVRERQQRRTAEQRQKAQSNEEAFAAWLHGKLRNSINKHQNMYDVKQSATSSRSLQQQQQTQNPKYRRRNGIHAMHQISYG